jgi:FSR family fosmidomycin resistance protein-like MFS transporter
MSSRPPRLGLLAGAHFTVDAYSSFFTPLLPLLMAKFDLSLALVGLLVAIGSTSSSLTQPLFGWWSDRLRRPWFVAFGPLVAAVFLSAVGAAPNYPALLALLLVGGLGTAAFHPQGANLVTGGSRSRGIAMAMFVSGGSIGFALGPALAVATVGAFGLERSWLAALPGLAVCAGLLWWFRGVEPVPRAERASAHVSLRPVARPLALLYSIVVLRSMVSYGFMTFLPIYLKDQGWSVGAAGMLLTVFLVCGATGGFAGGWIGDRFGRRGVQIVSFLASGPLLFAFLFTQGPVSILLLVAGYTALQASLPINVVMGQELLPERGATIASLLMGGAWGVGALLIAVVGALGDRVGLHSALVFLAAMTVPGWLCAVSLPRHAIAKLEPVPAVELAVPPAGGGAK